MQEFNPKLLSAKIMEILVRDLRELNSKEAMEYLDRYKMILDDKYNLQSISSSCYFHCLSIWQELSLSKAETARVNHLRTLKNKLIKHTFENLNQEEVSAIKTLNYILDALALIIWYRNLYHELLSTEAKEARQFEILAFKAQEKRHNKELLDSLDMLNTTNINRQLYFAIQTDVTLHLTQVRERINTNLDTCKATLNQIKAEAITAITASGIILQIENYNKETERFKQTAREQIEALQIKRQALENKAKTELSSNNSSEINQFKQSLNLYSADYKKTKHHLETLISKLKIEEDEIKTKIRYFQTEYTNKIETIDFRLNNFTTSHINNFQHAREFYEQTKLGLHNHKLYAQDSQQKLLNFTSRIKLDLENQLSKLKLTHTLNKIKTSPIWSNLVDEIDMHLTTILQALLQEMKQETNNFLLALELNSLSSDIYKAKVNHIIETLNSDLTHACIKETNYILDAETSLKQAANRHLIEFKTGILQHINQLLLFKTPTSSFIQTQASLTDLALVEVNLADGLAHKLDVLNGLNSNFNKLINSRQQQKNKKPKLIQLLKTPIFKSQSKPTQTVNTPPQAIEKLSAHLTPSIQTFFYLINLYHAQIDLYNMAKVELQKYKVTEIYRKISSPTQYENSDLRIEKELTTSIEEEKRELENINNNLKAIIKELTLPDTVLGKFLNAYYFAFINQDGAGNLIFDDSIITDEDLKQRKSKADLVALFDSGFPLADYISAQFDSVSAAKKYFSYLLKHLTLTKQIQDSDANELILTQLNKSLINGCSHAVHCVREFLFIFFTKLRHYTVTHDIHNLGYNINYVAMIVRRICNDRHIQQVIDNLLKNTAIDEDLNRMISYVSSRQYTHKFEIADDIICNALINSENEQFNLRKSQSLEVVRQLLQDNFLPDENIFKLEKYKLQLLDCPSLDDTNIYQILREYNKISRDIEYLVNYNQHRKYKQTLENILVLIKNHSNQSTRTNKKVQTRVNEFLQKHADQLINANQFKQFTEKLNHLLIRKQKTKFRLPWLRLSEETANLYREILNTLNYSTQKM